MSTPLTAPQLATYRTHPQWADAYLWIDNPPVLFSGQVFLAGDPIYPINGVTATNVSGDGTKVEDGMLIIFGTAPGLDDLGRTAVKSYSSFTFILPRTSRGTEDGCVDISNNCYFSVLDTFPVFARHPFIDPITSITYKYSDQTFASFGGSNTPPIACMGTVGNVYADLVDSGDKITVSFDASDSFSPLGNSVTYLWDVKDGTITVGSSSSAAITATFPTGRRWIKLTVTDGTNGKTQVRRCLIVACKEGDPDFAPITNFAPGSLSFKAEGQNFSFRVFQDVPASVYPDGCAICYFMKTYYNGTIDNLNGSVVKFAGWHHTDPNSSKSEFTHLKRDTSFQCLDTVGKLASLVSFPQVIASNGAPTKFEEMTAPNIDKYLTYLWQYHSSGPILADFVRSGTGTTYPFVELGSNGSNLYEQIDGRARAIGYRLISDHLGRAVVKQDPLLWDTGSRPSNVIIDLQEDDWVGLEWTNQRPPRSCWMYGSAVVASPSAINAVFCYGPGLTPSQGLSQSEIGEMLVTGQTELDSRCGHAYARENASYSYFKIELLHGGDAAYEPLDWVRFNTSSSSYPWRDNVFTDQRALIVEVETTFDAATGQLHKTLTLERETVGTPAAVYVPPGLSNVDYVPPSFYFGDTIPDVPATPSTHDGTQVIVLEQSAIGKTGNWGDDSPSWTGIPTPAGVVSIVDIALDPFSPFFGPSQSGAIGAYLARTDGIYYSPDITVASPSWTLKNDYSAFGVSPSSGTIRVSHFVKGVFYFCFVFDPVGILVDKVRFAKFSSYGATIDWGPKVISTGDNGLSTYGFDIDNYGADEVLVAARDTASNLTQVYRVTNGGSPVALTGTTITTSNGNVRISFLQKPLYRFGGGSNSGGGGSESFFYTEVDSLGNTKIYKSTDGGTSKTLLRSVSGLHYPAIRVSSVCYTDNPNVMAYVKNDGGFSYSGDGGATWIDVSASVQVASQTTGWFPRLINGLHRAYLSGTTKIGQWTEGDASITDKTGDWASSIGTPVTFIKVIPLY